MSSYMVCHVPSELFSYIPSFNAVKVKAFVKRYHSKYKLVAMVDTDDLEKVFRLTNSIDCSWWENDNVTKKFNGDNCRSTSVGDIIIDGDNNVFIVGANGFIEF